MAPTPNLPVPQVLARLAVQVWGEDGRRWLDDLPHLAAAVQQRWDLRIGQPFALSCHWVGAAQLADGTPVVVKLGVPGAEHLSHEAAALRAFGGRGAVRLLGEAPCLGALLLERADPGTMAARLVPARDAEATDAVVEVARLLHVPPPPGSGLPALESERQAFQRYLERFGDAGPLRRPLVEQALDLFTDLCGSAGAGTVLHGDLHHDNVLAGRGGWLAIDPHGWVGDPGYDVGAMLYNPLHPLAPHGLLDLVPTRVQRLASGLGMPVERVRAWGFVMAVLSQVWTCQDGGQAQGHVLQVAELLRPG